MAIVMAPHNITLVIGLFTACLMPPAALASDVTYVSLSYDDALPSQLTHAVPALESFGFNASFYLVPTNPGYLNYEKEWASVAANGHELGNHSYTHPCRSSLPGRGWVDKDNDLDSISAEAMKQQIMQTNAALTGLDGQQSRTYTIPCGDILAAGEDYLPLIRDHVLAIKGRTLSSEEEVIVTPSEVSAEALISLITQQPDDVRIINVIFHGVGGDYLAVSNKAHVALLEFLAANREDYVVDTYKNIVEALNTSDAVASD